MGVEINIEEERLIFPCPVDGFFFVTFAKPNKVNSITFEK
jgi:hypothetical protein